MNSITEKISNLTSEELEILKTISVEGFVTADELALELDRPGDDLSELMSAFVDRGLVEAHTHNVGVDNENFLIYQVAPRVGKELNR